MKRSLLVLLQLAFLVAFTTAVLMASAGSSSRPWEYERVEQLNDGDVRFLLDMEVWKFTVKRNNPATRIDFVLQVREKGRPTETVSSNLVDNVKKGEPIRILLAFQNKSDLTTSDNLNYCSTYARAYQQSHTRGTIVNPFKGTQFMRRETPVVGDENLVVLMTANRSNRGWGAWQDDDIQLVLVMKEGDE